MRLVLDVYQAPVYEETDTECNDEVQCQEPRSCGSCSSRVIRMDIQLEALYFPK